VLEFDGRKAGSPGINKLANQQRAGGADLDARLRDMDAEGVDTSIVFPQKAMALYGMQDKELLIRCCDVYNEWLGAVEARSGGRVRGVAILPTIYHPETTRDYIQKVKGWGLKAMQIPYAPGDVEYNRSRMEPLWDAVEESGIPLSFHVRGLPTAGAGALGSDMTTSLSPYRRLWSLLTFSGILERHPAMNVVFTEGGIGWVAPALYDADKVQRQYGSGMVPQLAQAPSFYWHRQCFATFMDDPPGLKLIDDIGADHIMWSLDYPHPEGVFGEAVEVARSIFELVGEEAAKKVVGGNAARLWGI
jgi:predicted TIM-barrel fold metal-dependent hydrolase